MKLTNLVMGLSILMGHFSFPKTQEPYPFIKTINVVEYGRNGAIKVDDYIFHFQEEGIVVEDNGALYGINVLEIPTKSRMEFFDSFSLQILGMYLRDEEIQKKTSQRIMKKLKLNTLTSFQLNNLNKIVGKEFKPADTVSYAKDSLYMIIRSDKKICGAIIL